MYHVTGECEIIGDLVTCLVPHGILMQVSSYRTFVLPYIFSLLVLKPQQEGFSQFTRNLNYSSQYLQTIPNTAWNPKHSLVLHCHSFILCWQTIAINPSLSSNTMQGRTGHLGFIRTRSQFSSSQI